jgi:CubicO group peptidase (beta-lactamase class C family)
MTGKQKMKNLCVALLFFWSSFSASAQSLYFPPVTGNTWDTISPVSLNWQQTKIDSLYHFLDTNDTKAFILLKEGKIVLEHYSGTHDQSSLWYWASAGKSLTAFLVGLAQQDQYLSLSDTTSDYLGTGWTSCNQAQEEKITIRHQLSMSSGLDDGVADPYCTFDSCLNCLADAGTRWAYHNAPYTLLDSVMEVATGMPLNTYLNQKVKTATGMTGAFVKSGYNNVFYSNARSMARYGLLILNHGNWNGTQILTDTAFFNQMVQSSQSLNPSYGYLWWLNGKPGFMVPGVQFLFPGFLFPDAPQDAFAAMGKNGQFLNVIPSSGMVWIRMGESPGSAEVPYLLNNQIWQHINDLDGSVTGIDAPAPKTLRIQIYPNPTSGTLFVQSDHLLQSIELLGFRGDVLKTFGCNEAKITLRINDLPDGFYLLRITTKNGEIETRKVVVIRN